MRAGGDPATARNAYYYPFGRYIWAIANPKIAAMISLRVAAPTKLESGRRPRGRAERAGEDPGGPGDSESSGDSD